jgi:hypothetical protein
VIGNVLASYAFTIAGFLSVTVTFLYTLSDRPFLKVYIKRGNLGDLMFFHLIAFAVLATIFALSVVLVIAPHYLRFAIPLTAFSVLQVGAIMSMSYLLTTRAQEDPPK